MQAIPPISASHSEHFVPFFAVTDSTNVFIIATNYKRVILDSVPWML